MRLFIVAVVPPLDHKYVYGGVPPEGVAVAVPLLPPKHETGVELTWTVKAVAG